jgi:hypothetical protein
MAAQVIPLHRAETAGSDRISRPGRPSRTIERDLDHRFHADEEQEQARIASRLIDQLFVIAHDYGPVAMHVVAAMEHWHQRHARRWADEVADERVA